jgi:aspartate/methionine/tyrosine aminotransferase
LVIQDEEVRQTIINWKHYTTICPAAPTEFLALVALSVGDKLAQRSQGIIQQNLQFAEAFFSRWQDLFKWRPPLSGSVALVGIDVTSATSYCHHLAQDAGVLLLPATFMGSDDQHVRFGFGRRSFPSALSHYDAYLEQGTSMKEGRHP